MTTSPDSPNRDPEAVRIGATIRALRDGRGWKLIELAAAVDYSHGYLSKIERGLKKCPSWLARDIAAAIGVEPAAIVSPGYAYEPPTATETDDPANTAGQ
jgi:transcriptional regulator with XRE-family HTH domain